MEQKILQATQLSKTFSSFRGEEVKALEGVDVTVQEGEFVSFIGPSGCGKSTLLKLFAGLLRPTTGKIEEFLNPETCETDRGLIFQQYNLFPWFTVKENIAFGLTLQNVTPELKETRVREYLTMVGLEGFAHAYPKELSGGMQQRVALARALATHPKILFMDEPFSALDMQTKRHLQESLLAILAHEPRTVIFVTHDVEEAVLLSDTIYVMSARPGKIVEKISVDLPHPRRLDMEFSPEFLKMKQRIQSLITLPLGNSTHPHP